MEGRGSPSKTKGRRVLGEVQLEISGLSGSNSNLVVAADAAIGVKLSRAHTSERSLKDQFNTTAQHLFKKDEHLQDIQKAVLAKSDTIQKLEGEKGRLVGELKALALEKDQMNALLQEELDVRRMIQIESQKLIADIKSSYENKISKLREELRSKEEVVGIKEDLIRNMEALIKKLRAEISSLNAKLARAKAQEGAVTGALSTSFRGSLSILQSQLEGAGAEAEEKIKGLEAKYAEQLSSREKEFEDELRSVVKAIGEKSKELEEVRGRLEESREARERTLLDMHNAEMAYNEGVKELEDQLEAAFEQIEALKSAAGENSGLGAEVQSLREALEASGKVNDELTEKLATVESNKLELEGKFKNLAQSLKETESKLREVEGEKQKLYKKTEEALVNKLDSSALLLLQEQLAAAQTKLDETKEALASERSRVAELSTALSAAEKSFGLSKVDVRILSREKTGLEARLATKGEAVVRLTTELDELRAKNSEFEAKLAEQEKVGKEAGKAKEEAEFHLEAAKRGKEAALEEKARLERNVVEFKEEIIKLKESLASFDELKSSSGVKEAALKKKEEELEAATRKISSLQANVGLLKQTSTILNNQLKEFEASYGKKLKELQEVEGIKTKLSEENSSLKESFQFSKIELNEALSLKSFFERRVSELEFSAKASATSAADSNSALTAKITELTSKNAELKDIGNKLASELEAVTEEKTYALSRLDEARADNLTLTREIHKTMEIVFDLKHEISELESKIEEIKEAGEGRVKELSKRWNASLQTKEASNLQLQCTVEQQAKLIDFLQQQNVELSKKKKGFGAFFSRDKDKEEYTPVKKGVTLPRNMNFDTPTSTPIPISGVAAGPKPTGLRYGKCEEAEFLKAELDELKKQPESQKVVESSNSKPKISSVPLLSLSKSCPVLDINSVVHVADDLYLLGCDQGLFSRRMSTQGTVKISGVGAVAQMEFVPSLNSLLLLEGAERRLLLAPNGLVRSAAEAAACSAPKLVDAVCVCELTNIAMFEIREDCTLAASCGKALYIFGWDSRSRNFVVRQKIPTPEPVTCMAMGAASVIYGAGKVWEVDTKNYQVEEFLDETDSSLYFVIFGGDELNIPMAIIDIGMSNWTPEKKSYSKEYLICFPTLGIFVDENGQRSRPEDINWQKFPTSINYRHPILYIFHYSSVEMIRLDGESFTSSRIEVTKESVGRLQAVIPSSVFLPLPAPKFLGRGAKSATIVVGCRDKSKTEVYEIGLEPCSGDLVNFAEANTTVTSSDIDFGVLDD